MKPRRLTILHVEDDPALANLVCLSFVNFGFKGEILQASLVAEAYALLSERERKKQPLDLVLVDLQLPDGTGLDVLRHVKASQTWHRTPVIVLSGEDAPRVINEAYALGANCYFPKLSGERGAFGSIQTLYQCWIEGALLPQGQFQDQVEEALAKGVRLRARAAQFYFGLARASMEDPGQEGFWLERAMIEGNMSNLLVFFQGQVGAWDVPSGVVEHAAEMQLKVEEALNNAEALLRTQPSPAQADICRWVLDLVEAWDEKVFAEAFGVLWSKSRTVTLALEDRAVGQLRNLAKYVLQRCRAPELERRAEALLGFADRLETMLKSEVGTGSDRGRPLPVA